MVENSEIKELMLVAETVQVLLNNVAQAKVLCDTAAKSSVTFNKRFPQFKKLANEIKQQERMFENLKDSLSAIKEITEGPVDGMPVRQKRHLLAQIEKLETTLNTILN